MLGDEWYWFFVCGIVGILTGIAFVYITQYYTAGSWRPVQEIAEASRPARRRTSSSARRSASRPRPRRRSPSALALVASFLLGSQCRHRGRRPGFTAGIFGTAVATMGMLMSAAYILAMDTFGPITDNAGGITEMSGAPESARADHRRAGRRRQHDEGADQGLRGRLRRPGGLPALHRLPRQGQGAPRAFR